MFITVQCKFLSITMIKSYIYTHHIVNKLTVALQIYSKVLMIQSGMDILVYMYYWNPPVTWYFCLNAPLFFRNGALEKYSTIKIDVKIFQKYTELYRFDKWKFQFLLSVTFIVIYITDRPYTFEFGCVITLGQEYLIITNYLTN